MNELIWTKKLPTVGGWYWVKNTNFGLVEMKYLKEVFNDVLLDGFSVHYAVGCEWAGPILPPKEEAE